MNSSRGWENCSSVFCSPPVYPRSDCCFQPTHYLLNNCLIQTQCHTADGHKQCSSVQTLCGKSHLLFQNITLRITGSLASFLGVIYRRAIYTLTQKYLFMIPVRQLHRDCNLSPLSPFLLTVSALYMI